MCGSLREALLAELNWSEWILCYRNIRWSRLWWELGWNLVAPLKTWCRWICATCYLWHPHEKQEARQQGWSGFNISLDNWVGLFQHLHVSGLVVLFIRPLLPIQSGWGDSLFLRLLNIAGVAGRLEWLDPLGLECRQPDCSVADHFQASKQS